MHLRPFLILTTCLLGACEKKDAAPGSQPPGIASTKSSLRNPESLSNRRERSADHALPGNVMEAIDRYIHRLATGEGHKNAKEEALHAIMDADPAAFETIWKKLGESDFPATDLRRAAIYHLGAKNDLAASVRLARELWFPGVSAETRAEFIALLPFEHPTSVEGAIAFIREIESEEDRDSNTQSLTLGDSAIEELRALKDSDIRLNERETAMIMKAIQASVNPINVFSARTLDEVLAAYQRSMEIVAPLEDQNILAKGARRRLLLEFSGSHAGVFFEKIPPHERLEFLRMEGSERVIGTLIESQYGDKPPASLPRVVTGEIPGLFFTATGITANLPPERIGAAVAAWQSIDSSGAEAWLAANGASMPLPQVDDARSRIALALSLSGEAAEAKGWVDQIQDPTLRESSLADLKTIQSARAQHSE